MSNSKYMQIAEDEDFLHFTQEIEVEIYQKSQARLTQIQWKKAFYNNGINARRAKEDKQNMAPLYYILSRQPAWHKTSRPILDHQYSELTGTTADTTSDEHTLEDITPPRLPKSK